MQYTYRVVLEGRLPGLNELMSSQGRPWWAADNAKKKAMKDVEWQLLASKVPKFTKPITVRIVWVEKDARRDRDNVTGGGSKVIFDAMKHLGIIKNDGRRWVKDTQHDTTKIDKDRPRVEIWIQEDA